jgi:shikimate dehydrogenase
MRHACVVGHNIAHSRSPLIHGYWIRKHCLDADYTIRDLDAAQLPSLIDELRQRQLEGCNVTVPHKQTIIPLLDRIDEAARQTGSVNTVYNDQGVISGTSTDGEGFLTHLLTAHPSFSLSRCHVVILGAGGAARSIIGAMTAAGVSAITVANRSRARAQEIASLAPALTTVVSADDLELAAQTADIVINSTSLGTGGKGEFPFPMQITSPNCIFADIVYVPLTTPFLARAEALGRPTLDGLGMLLHQAVRGFELWFGIRPEVTPELRRLVEQDILASG